MTWGKKYYSCVFFVSRRNKISEAYFPLFFISSQALLFVSWKSICRLQWHLWLLTVSNWSDFVAVLRISLIESIWSLIKHTNTNISFSLLYHTMKKKWSDFFNVIIHICSGTLRTGNDCSWVCRIALKYKNAFSSPFP